MLFRSSVVAEVVAASRIAAVERTPDIVSQQVFHILSSVVGGVPVTDDTLLAPLGLSSMQIATLRDDLVEALLWMAKSTDLAGPVNAAAPGEVTNLEFTKTLGRVLKRPTIFPVPRFMLRLLIGQFAEILVASSRIAPGRLLDAGFPFNYPDLEAALRHLLGRE